MEIHENADTFREKFESGSLGKLVKTWGFSLEKREKSDSLFLQMTKPADELSEVMAKILSNRVVGLLLQAGYALGKNYIHVSGENDAAMSVIKISIEVISAEFEKSLTNGRDEDLDIIQTEIRYALGGATTLRKHVDALYVVRGKSAFEQKGK